MRHSAAFALAAAALLGAFGSACAGSDDGNEPEASRCERVPREVVEAIEARLTVTGGGTLTNAWAVRSTDYTRVYFVSGDLDGEGLDGPDDIGTWVKSGPLRVGRGLILSVDNVAKEFSDWGDAGKTISMSDDGAQESIDCVKETG